MKKVLAILALCAGTMNADVIRFHGTVTSVPLNSPISVGETYEAWMGFYVWDSTTYAPWTPQAVHLTCGLVGQCSIDLPGHSVQITGRGITFSGGTHWSDQGWGDGGTVYLASDLSVLGAVTTSSLDMGFTSDPEYSQDNYMKFYIGLPGYVTGGATSAEFIAGVPEPSTMLLSAPVLLGLWGYGRVRASRSAGRRSYEIPSA